jgi:hypothetical protein
VGAFVFLVPALLVVVLGYAIWGWVADVLHAVLGTSLGRSSPEPAGWLTGLALLAVLTCLALRWRRRRAGPRP